MPADNFTQGDASGPEPESTGESVDFRAFVALVQATERKRTCLIHDLPLMGKSAFARKFAATTPGGIYINVLDRVADDPNLCAQVDVLDATFLRSLLLTTTREAQASGHAVPVICLDDLDFLLPVWDGWQAALLEMARSLRAEEINAVPLLFLQTRPAWQQARERGDIKTTTGASRILELGQIAAI